MTASAPPGPPANIAAGDAYVDKGALNTLTSHLNLGIEMPPLKGRLSDSWDFANRFSSIIARCLKCGEFL